MKKIKKSNFEKKTKASQKSPQNSEYKIKTSVHGSYNAQMLLENSAKDLFCSKLLLGQALFHFQNGGYGFPYPHGLYGMSTAMVLWSTPQAWNATK